MHHLPHGGRGQIDDGLAALRKGTHRPEKFLGKALGGEGAVLGEVFLADQLQKCRGLNKRWARLHVNAAEASHREASGGAAPVQLVIVYAMAVGD